jgi:hypothetical protein
MNDLTALYALVRRLWRYQRQPWLLMRRLRPTAYRPPPSRPGYSKTRMRLICSRSGTGPTGNARPTVFAQTRELGLFMSVSFYSDRTKCPACSAKVCLADVGLTPTFSCPACQEQIQISPLYYWTQRITVWALALFIAYVVGRDRFWLVMLLWILLTVILTLLWLVIGRFLLPPRLVRSVPDPSHFQGLGLGPK